MAGGAEPAGAPEVGQHRSTRHLEEDGIAALPGDERLGSPVGEQATGVAIAVAVYGGEGRPGWNHYEQRKTLKVGETVTAGPEPYAKVKLVEIAEDRQSAVFEAQHLVDRRRGRVVVGDSFHVFTSVFGSKGARLESIDEAGATVVFRWAQSRGLPVPPGAVARSVND